MKYYNLLIFIILFQPGILIGQVSFDDFFQDRTMRIDYLHSGDATSESAEITGIYAYGIWAGTKSRLTDGFNYGKSLYKIVDKDTGKLIYSKGFDNYFNEYQTTEPAIAGETKTFYESAIIPFPTNTFFFILEKRDSLNQLKEIFKAEIDPKRDVSPLRLDDKTVQVFKVLNNGVPEKKVDIVIIGDGYTADEVQKFEKDLHRATDDFFSIEPLKSYRDKFNVSGIFKPSKDSGVSDPVAGKAKNTVLSTSFNALGVDRYLITEDLKSVSDIAAYAPHDAIFIMANSNKYGGGGIYNFYCTFTSDDVNSGFLMVHEFGHSFFGLADEYYASSTAYNNFYPEGYEPLEPNITANTDRETLKWKDLLTEPIDIPTPWEKARYDSIEMNWQKEKAILNEKLEKLKIDKAPESKISDLQVELYKKDIAHRQAIRDILTNSQFAGKVGAFEGAGYTSKGLYRPSLTCIMFTQENHFCPVCTDSMIDMINWYTGD